MNNKKKRVLLSSIALLLVLIVVAVIFVISGNKPSFSENPPVSQDSGLNDVIDDAFDKVDELLEDVNFDDELEDFDDELEDFDDELEDFDDEEIFEFEEDEIEYYGNNPKEGSLLDSSNTLRNINVNLNKNAYDYSFLGLGWNTWGVMTNDKCMSRGYDPVSYALLSERLDSSNITYSRMLVDMDVMITDTESNPTRKDFWNNSDYKNYTNGVYDFSDSNDDWIALKRNLEMCQKAGVKVWLNTGWKVDGRIATWYSLREDTPLHSAPYDVKAFIKANIALLAEIEKEFPGVVKFICLGNETNGHVGSNSGDFADLGDTTRFWLYLSQAMSDALEYSKEQNWIANDLEYALTETNECYSGLYERTPENIAKITKEAGKENLFSTFSDHMNYAFHNPDNPLSVSAANNDYNHVYSAFACYYTNTGVGAVSNEAYPAYFYTDEEYNAAKDKNEHDPRKKRTWSWSNSTASFYIATANGGGRGVNFWYGTGDVWWNFMPSLGFSYFDQKILPTCMDTKRIGELGMEYYNTSLWQTYVPYGSTVLKLDWEGQDVRTTAFKTPDGNYTFVVEANDSAQAERTIKFNFDSSLGKTLYRHYYRNDVNYIKRNANATIITADKEFKNVGTTVSDKISSQYGVYVYTTIPSVTQIEIGNDCVAYVKSGESVDLTATLIDNQYDENEIVWEVVATSDKTFAKTTFDKMNNSAIKGSLSTNHDGSVCTYTVANSAELGDRIAVKASLKGHSDVCEVAIIEIVE